MPIFIAARSGQLGILKRRYTIDEIAHVVIRCGGPSGPLEDILESECKKLDATDENEALDETRRWLRDGAPLPAGPQICTACQGPIDEDGECRCQECETCLGGGRIRDGETRELRKCLDCNGAGMLVTGPGAL